MAKALAGKSFGEIASALRVIAERGVPVGGAMRRPRVRRGMATVWLATCLVAWLLVIVLDGVR